jgi:hypothetical protein
MAIRELSLCLNFPVEADFEVAFPKYWVPVWEKEENIERKKKTEILAVNN